ncbi:response regulator [Lysinibacillus sp. SGAir0095]|uniref:response regulator n=1 Tax=Lysinibacillus sp. SGAir0095 TaxID=2070463 RepID=UPI0010CCB920|nr:response regulator [Lysinibacillus sp. SGAir0095]QCR33703.1 hybrid sensor histidine kinase/response regulator [Lysinibacillus sp. SGAir0095]
MKSRIRLGIRSKITFGYVIIVLALIFSAIFLNNQMRSLQDERNQIIKYDSQILGLSNNIEKNILEMQAGKRGYIITGDDGYLESYYQATENWEKDYNNLYSLLKDNPEQQEKLSLIKATINHWISTSGDPVIAMKRDGNTGELAEHFRVDEGRADLDYMGQQFEEFRIAESEAITAITSELDNQNNRISIAIIAFLIIVTLTAITIATTVSSSIIKTVQNVTNSIHRISASKGDYGERIQVNTNDEIKELAMATNELLDSVENREWLQSNLASLLTKYQGISSINKLSEIFLTEITKITDATYGAFYIANKDLDSTDFIKTASFSGSGQDIGRESFKLGEGLIGQVAIKQQVFHSNNLPKDYRLINTGLGEIPPQSLLIVPVKFEENTIAVIELASIENFNTLEIELVENVLESFGLTVNSIMDRMEIVRLLNESRAMTEELQAQSEELQSQSEELQSQSEELQMQTEELTIINEQLEERTKDAEAKSKELEVAKKELEATAGQLILSSNYKSEFLANMSHELRTPLNSILILSEMLGENDTNNLTDEQAEFAKVIHSSGQDLLALINDILDLSKVEAGKLDILFGEVNMDELPHLLEQTFTPIAKQKELEFNIIKASNVNDIFHTDEKRFNQILKNLLSNAFKFTEQGSVTLAIKQLEEQQISTNMQQLSKDWLEVAIIDTGIGISKEKHQLIFESFQQADGATVRKYGGTGLGLSISKEFSKLLGGWIDLKSEEGKGSTFTLILPSLPNGLSEECLKEINEDFTNIGHEEVAATQIMNDNPIEVEIVEQPEPDVILKPTTLTAEFDILEGKNVLIVDDDNRNIFALKTALEHNGVNILVAKHGLECLEIMQTNKEIDLVLMDIMMPVMDGYETMTKIRKELKLTEIPIIAITAKAMKNDRDKCIEAGASDYISKPINLEQLFSVLRVWLVSQGSMNNDDSSI